MKNNFRFRPAHRRSLKLLVGFSLTIVLALSLAACGSSDEPEAVPTQVPTLAAPEPTATAEPTATPEPTAVSEPTATSEPEAEVAETTEVTTTAEMTATEMTATEEEIAPRVFFLQPTDNAILPPSSVVKMGVEGLTVQPAGAPVEGAGHLHIAVDSAFVAPGEVVASDETHLHFGEGSLESEVTLAPGPHILRLQFADGAHTALEGDQYRAEIVVSVVEGAPEQAVRFVVPTDGATVPALFDVILAATGVAVQPSDDVLEGTGHAHEAADHEHEGDSGHLHILVDTDFVAPGELIPDDESHVHFANGQLQSTLELAPGEHVLRLQVADGGHNALEGDQYREEIAITVEEDAPANQVLFVEPVGGATVKTEFPVKWAASGLIIEPAGPVIAEDRGHLHVLVDTDFIPAGEAIAKDETHLHFGGGQRSTELTLEPGEHTLRLQMANGAHIAMEGDQYRDEITITVEE